MSSGSQADPISAYDSELVLAYVCIGITQHFDVDGNEHIHPGNMSSTYIHHTILHNFSASFSFWIFDSLQFEPAPRRGEPDVTRRTPDYFL